jgi:hypothetical protein
VAKFGYAVLLRTLTAMGGAVAAYGATGMFTSGGIMPPERDRHRGPRDVRRFTPGTVGVRANAHRRLAGTADRGGALLALRDRVAPVGTHALAVISPIVALIGVAALVLDLRMLARVVRVGPKGRAALQTGSR